MFNWVKEGWKKLWSDEAESEVGLSRRAFLKGFGAVAAAAMVAPAFPAIEDVFDTDMVESIRYLTEHGWDIVKQIEQTAMEEIMAIEDARFFAAIEQTLAWTSGDEALGRC